LNEAETLVTSETGMAWWWWCSPEAAAAATAAAVGIVEFVVGQARAFGGVIDRPTLLKKHMH